MNFRQLDLNLLRVLAAIHRARSVTAAGKSLSLSQSATSNALARLRRFFNDDLFVRSPAGLQPTRLCETLAPAVLMQLAALEGLVTGHEHFDPATSDMHWKLSLSDLGEMLLLPPLAAALRAQAPHAHLSNISVAAADGQIATGLTKFGAIVGDRSEIGCNAVINPGSIIGRDCIIYPGTNFRGALDANAGQRHLNASRLVETIQILDAPVALNRQCFQRSLASEAPRQWHLPGWDVCRLPHTKSDVTWRRGRPRAGG